MLKFYCYNFTSEKTTAQIIEDIKTLCDCTKQYEREEEIMLFVIVPAVSLEAVCAAFPDRKLVKISSQSLSVKGITDELTPEKLREAGADMAITGLTDRRYYLGETSEMTRDNLEVILGMGFKAMLCVGETREMAQKGTAAEVIAAQLGTGYSRVPYEAHYRIGTVYRPLWDFGSGYTPDEDYTLDMLKTIRETVKKTLPGFPIEMPLFYGGILSPEKLSEYFQKGIIDGVFWDSRNITVEEFVKMIHTIG